MASATCRVTRQWRFGRGSAGRQEAVSASSGEGAVGQDGVCRLQGQQGLRTTSIQSKGVGKRKSSCKSRFRQFQEMLLME